MEAEVRGETARLQAEVEIAKLQQGQGQLDIERFKAQWEGIRAAVSVYATEIDALKAQVDIQRLPLQAHELDVRTYEARINAWAKQWDGYASKMQGEKLKVDQFDAYIKAHLATIQVYDAQIRGETSRLQGEVEFAKAQGAVGEIDIRRFEAQWGAISAKLKAFSDVVNADATIYKARSDGSLANVTASVEAGRFKVSEAQLQLQAQVESARLAVQQLSDSKRLAEAAEASLGTIYSQLLAATYASYSISTSSSQSITDSSSRSQSSSSICTTDGD